MQRADTQRSMHERLRSERGVSLIQVGLAILVLTGFTAFVLDYGVLWLGRRQAQNAADSGALAGAIARAFDETANPPEDDGPAYESASLAAGAHFVVGETPAVAVSWECPAFAAGGRCVRVDVFRDGAGNGSTPLPTFFANLFGIGSQPVRATATAWVANANTTNCMRPFAVADRWIENADPDAVAPNEKFDRWQRVGSNAVEYDPKDQYVPPSLNSTGSGYTVDGYLGTQLVLKGGNNPNTSAGAVTPGWFLPLQLPDGEGGWTSGADDFRDAIKTCIGNPVSIGQYIPTATGAQIGPTKQGVKDNPDSLVNQDPDATWDEESQSVVGTCAPACGPFSPRIVPITVFDMDEFQWRAAANNWNTSWIPGVGPGTEAFACPIGGRCVRVANIIGFFVEGMNGNDVTGRLVMYPGEFVVGPPGVGAGSSFLQAIQLIR
jgi:hypothetical protein